MKATKLMTKILLFIGVPVLIIYIIMITFITQSVKQSSIKSSTDILTAKSQSAANEINNYFSKYETIVEQLTQNDLLQQYFEKPLQEKNSNTRNGYGGIKATVSNIYKTDSANLSSVWVSDCTDNIMLSNSTAKPYRQELSERPWYKTAVEKKGIVLVDPYKDTITGKIVMSIISPIYKTGTDKLVGFAGIDITLNRLYNTIKNYKLGNSGFYILTSADGQLIYYPDESLKNKNITKSGMSSNAVESIQKKTSKFMTYTAMGTKNYGYISKVGDTGWTVVTGLPEKEFLSSYRSVFNSALWIFIIALAIIIALIVIMSKRIVRPLEKLKNTANAIADGNLDVNIEVTSSDEIGQVSSAFSRTVKQLKHYIEYINEITASLNKIAAGDLTFELHCDYTGEFSKIKVSLENIKSTLTDLLSEIDASASQVATGSDQVANASQALAQGSTEQASSVEELSASVTEISQKVINNAGNAESLKKLFENVSTELMDGNNLMQQLMKAMTDIHSSSDQINKIIKAIEEIAFQTNILALNAAVEAAHAGEAGKGFAVVAEEVRNLAGKSAEAAKSTTALVQSEILSVKHGSEIADSTSQAMNTIVDSSNKCTDLINKIAEDSNTQATAVKEVTQGLDQISSVVQNNSATSEESAASSEELNGQAQSLKTLIQQFKF